MVAVEFGNSTINYQIIRSNRKTVGLEVSIEEGVIVRAPEKISEERIKEVVKKKAEWIMRKQKRLDEIKPAPKPKEFISGERLPYLGRRYRLKVKRVDTIGVSVNLYQGKLMIDVGSDLGEYERKEIIKNKVMQWYRKHAEKQIKERVKKYQNKIGVEPNSIKIKKQKKRWGSCSSLGNLNFNWKLIMAPMRIIDYIVVHELAHLKYPNHSKEYWDLVESIIPDYEQKQEWLRINGRQLDLK